MYFIHGIMFTIFHFFSLLTPYNLSFNGCWGLNPEELGVYKCFYFFPTTPQETAMMMGKWTSAPLFGLAFFLLHQKNRNRR